MTQGGTPQTHRFLIAVGCIVLPVGVGRFGLPLDASTSMGILYSINKYYSRVSRQPDEEIQEL